MRKWKSESGMSSAKQKRAGLRWYGRMPASEGADELHSAIAGSLMPGNHKCRVRVRVFILHHTRCNPNHHNCAALDSCELVSGSVDSQDRP